MQLTGEEYDSLYTDVEREMRRREMLCRSLRTTTAKEHIRQMTKAIVSRQNRPLWNTANDRPIQTITHLAVRCNHNATRRMRSQRSKTRPNDNCEHASSNGGRHNGTATDGGESLGTVIVAPNISTILVANAAKEDYTLIRTSQLLRAHHDLLAMDEYIGNLDYRLFVRTLEKELGFEGSCNGIYYYTKAGDGWARVRVSTEARWHGALQDTVALKAHKATFVIEPLT